MDKVTFIITENYQYAQQIDKSRHYLTNGSKACDCKKKRCFLANKYWNLGRKVSKI